MILQKDISLKPFNTFGIDQPAEYFVEVTGAEQLEEVAGLPYHKHVLGGGSNILLTSPVKGLVLRNSIEGISVVREDSEHVWLRAAAGEVWHGLVLYAIERGWGGIENLARIPGTVGAAPIQNIGAYGVEARETIEHVTCWHWPDKKFITLGSNACEFGYRDSVFKHQLKDKVFITSVVFKLSKQPRLNTTYGAIEEELAHMQVQAPTVQSIAAAVMNIRRSKLPDPAKIGNAGSFFKNPAISMMQYLALQEEHPQIPSYPAAGGLVKVPAGWLIEQCGWKGHRRGETGVHAKQALVLVNYGHAQGAEIWELSGEIVRSVQERFHIELEREVQVW